MLRKCFVSILTFWCLHSFAQIEEPSVLDRKISITFSNVSLPAAIRQLNKQAKVLFSYNSNIIPKGDKIISSYQNESLRQILDDLFLGANLYYKELNGNILINKRAFNDRVLRGKVVESEGNSPLPFANVFIDNSILGVPTEVDGTFELKQIPEGTFDLVISYLGYEPKMIPYRFDPENPDKELIIELTVDPKQLESVIVKYEKPKKRERRDRKLLQRFVTEFLGQGDNSKKCSIVNPQDFQVVELTSPNSYKVTADKPVYIENRALGYRVTFYLDEFTFLNGAQSTKGKAMFEELEPKSRKQNQQWDNAREKAYRGSLPHFLNSLIEDNLEEEGFQINTVQFDSVTSEYFSTTHYGANLEEVLSLEKIEGTNKYLLKTNSDIEVTYKNEFEDSDYVKRFRSKSKHLTYKYTDRKTISRVKLGDNQSLNSDLNNFEISSLQLFQTSVILFNKRETIIDYPGNFTDENDVRYLGWWNWGGVSEILPFYYDPDN